MVTQSNPSRIETFLFHAAAMLFYIVRYIESIETSNNVFFPTGTVKAALAIRATAFVSETSKEQIKTLYKLPSDYERSKST
jgi:hypothetical protein